MRRQKHILNPAATDIKWRDFQPVDDDGFAGDRNYSKVHAFVPAEERFGDTDKPTNITLCGKYSLWNEDCKPMPFDEVEAGYWEGNARCGTCLRLAKGIQDKEHVA